MTGGLTGGFGSAARYLLVRAELNRWRRLARRVREPRFALGVLAFIGYVGVIVSTTDWLSTARSSQAGVWLLASFVLFPIASQWVFGGDDEVITFTEPEIQFLFPAPASRRALIAYKIVRGAVGALPFVVFTTVVMGGRLAAHPAWFGLGVWIAFVTVDLHVAGASRVRAWAAARGLRGWVRRIATMAVGLGGVGALVAASAARVELAPVTFQEWLVWFARVAETAPMSWALAPLRAAPAVAMSSSLAEGLAALPFAVAVLAAHAGWVMQAASFEDGAVSHAARIHTLRENRGRIGMVRLGALQIPLSSRGPAWVGLAWKGLIGSIRLAPIRLVFVFGMGGLIGVLAAMAALEEMSAGGIATLGAIAAAVSAAYLAAFGPATLRTDLRQDVGMLDVLRALPVRGRDVVIGEVMGPWLVLAVGEWLCVLAAFVLSGQEDQLGLGPRAAGALMAAIELPVATLVGLTVQNAAVVLFPEPDAAGGFDMAGRRLITLAATLFVLIGAGGPTLLAAIPAALLQPALGWVVWPLAAAAGVLPVLVAMRIAAGWMGRRLERLDPSTLG